MTARAAGGSYTRLATSRTYSHHQHWTVGNQPAHALVGGRREWNVAKRRTKREQHKDGTGMDTDKGIALF